jgi:hypothetical protein
MFNNKEVFSLRAPSLAAIPNRFPMLSQACPSNSKQFLNVSKQILSKF